MMPSMDEDRLTFALSVASIMRHMALRLRRGEDPARVAADMERMAENVGKVSRRQMEKLGADFARAWDDNAAKLYET